MRRVSAILILAALLLALCGCGSGDAGSAAPAAAPTEDPGTQIHLTGGSAEITGGGARVQGGTVTISAVGTYTLSGTLDEGQIVVDTGDDAMDVTLILDGVSVTNSAGPAIHIRQAKDTRLQLRGENRLVSGTEADLAAYDGSGSGAALYAEDDLDIEGEGSLEILGYLNNGLTCKDDLDINSGTITVTAANNGIRTSDSLQLKGGTVFVTAGNDGLKAQNAKRDGKDYVELRGGSLTVEAGGDGIQAGAAGSGVGEIRLTGASVQIFAHKQALQAESGVLLQGGEVLALCGSHNQAAPDEAQLPYLLCALSGSAGDAVTIGEARYDARAAYKTVFFASASLHAGESVTVSNGRSETAAAVS
ncbi:MAG: carbohydrate-binding domain-containing protein [Oscillospiraceae bacterium]|nr:carbohydrate-binding domain-containing protein [Oscillospiraceae bacterium]